MIAETIGSLIRSFVDGVIVLNDRYEILWMEAKAELELPVESGGLLPWKHEISAGNETFQIKLTNNKTIVANVKRISLNQEFLILCLEDLHDVSSNMKTRLYCLENIIGSLNEGIMMSDHEGKIVLYNETQEKLEGLDSRDIQGKHLWEAYNYNPQYSEHKHTFKTGKPIFSRYRAHATVNGVPRYVNYSTYPINKDGETIAVFSISTNESNLKNQLYQTIEQRRQAVHSDSNQPSLKNGTIYTFNDIKGKSIALRNLIHEAENIALYNTDVLIVGETGTGKELLAQSIHNHSPRAASPFVAINCAAIPETLLESTLFGTVKGAFTGAVNQIGLFEYAKDGTLFLDEINSMPITLQSKLIRVLQERGVRRVGSNEVTPVECTVISASNEDPEKLIEEGKMRLDLFYRLAHTSLYIPPLRERTEDIHFFIQYFLEKYRKKFNKAVPGLSPSLFSTLLQYHWPGNTRELEHLIENLIIRANESDQDIDVEHLPTYMKKKLLALPPNLIEKQTNLQRNPLKTIFSNSQEHYIQKTLNETNWNISKAAKLLGITRQSLQYHIKKYGLAK